MSHAPGALRRAEAPLPRIIAARAEHSPDQSLHQIVDGPAYSYAQFHQRNLDWASAFAGLGIRSDQTVVTMLPISVDAHHAWLGLAWLGAIEVPINHDYRGQLLRYAIERTGARVVVIVARFLPRFAEIAAELPNDLVVIIADADDATTGGVRTLGRSAFFAQASTPPLRTPDAHDIACILFTSGTTGPSKAVRVPWRQLFYTAVAPPDDALRHGEAFYSTWPAFHASGKSALYLPAVESGRLVSRDLFSASAFWDDVRRYPSAFALLGGPLVHFLLAQPARDDDAEHPLRGVWSSPLSKKTIEFSHRFAVKIATAFGMTEIGTPISSGGWVEDHWDSCGRVRIGPPGYEIRIVDEHDWPVPTGQVGELIIRASEPWALNAGYQGMPDKTADAWRNGWFHTGDAFRMDDTGRLYYVDRRKDCIRRRGENVSSFEVERYALEHPGVRECAAIGVPSEYGEEEVKICVVPSGERVLDPESLFHFLAARMPRFMVPRYIEFWPELPKTEATLRVRKNQLREHALDARTWDRERAGLTVPRDA